MSEAGTGATSDTERLLSIHLRTTVTLALIAAFLWALAIAGAAAVVIDRMPDLIAGTVLAMAGTTTVLAGTLAGGQLRQRATHAAVVEPLGLLAAQLEQLSARLDQVAPPKSGGDFWGGYTAAVDDLNGGQGSITSLDAKRRLPN